MNFDAIHAQQIPPPFYQNVITKSFSHYHQEVMARHEAPLLIADQDYCIENFKDI